MINTCLLQEPLAWQVDLSKEKNQNLELLELHGETFKKKESNNRESSNQLIQLGFGVG